MSAILASTQTNGDVRHVVIPHIIRLDESEINASTTVYRLRLCMGDCFLEMNYDTTTTMEAKRDSILNTIEAYYA